MIRRRRSQETISIRSKVTMRDSPISLGLITTPLLIFRRFDQNRSKALPLASKVCKWYTEKRKLKRACRCYLRRYDNFRFISVPIRYLSAFGTKAKISQEEIVHTDRKSVLLFFLITTFFKIQGKIRKAI